MHLIQHDDLVIVLSIIVNVSQRQQTGSVREDGLSPAGILFMRDEHLGLIVTDHFVQSIVLVEFFELRKVVLVELQSHLDSRRDDASEHVHVSEHPLVTLTRYSEE